jgi:hypothetical protein
VENFNFNILSELSLFNTATKVGIYFFLFYMAKSFF